jgi:hypothetical protein
MHDWPPAHKILTQLVLQLDMSALQILVLTGLWSEDSIHVGKFLRALGPQLKYLELQLASRMLSMSTVNTFLHVVTGH